MVLYFQVKPLSKISFGIPKEVNAPIQEVIDLDNHSEPSTIQPVIAALKEKHEAHVLIIDTLENASPGSLASLLKELKTNKKTEIFVIGSHQPILKLIQSMGLKPKSVPTLAELTLLF